jgi:hypothetical protein
MTAPTRSPATRDDVRSTAINGVQPKPQDDIEVGVSAHLPWQTPYKDAWEALRTDDVTVRSSSPCAAPTARPVPCTG